MSAYKEGDLIEATKDETVMRGRLWNDCSGAVMLGNTCNTLHWLTESGFTVTLIERKPEPLPTELNSVVRFECDADRRHVLAWLAFDGTWDLLDSKGNAHTAVVDPYAWLKEQGLDLDRVTRLIPEVTS